MASSAAPSPSDDVARARLAAQGISGSAGSTVAETAAAMLATQAQDLPAATWALALRTRGETEAPTATAADVSAAFARREVVRSWPARGTLMITAADDVRWLTGLLAPRAAAAARGTWRRAGLEPRHFATARDAVVRALAGGRLVSRADLLAAVGRAGVDTGSERGSHLLRWLSGERVIVLGAPRGTEQTVALLDDWLPDARRLDDRDEALGELARRWLAHRSPATVRDLAWWSGLTLTDVRRAVEITADVDVTEAGDVEWLDRRAAGGAPAGTARGGDPPARGDLRLLPPFDELLLGYADRGASLDPADKARLVPSSNGGFRPAIVVDGRVVGTWRRTLTRRTVTVELDPWVPLVAGQRARLQERQAEYARHLGRELVRPDGSAPDEADALG
ncbi:winged helix DNA-binding protein [Frigoribacterium sp. PhB160]|uniref:winged helix DNA-binding domain-containing protein n=1 Tax=Frigoribacterium sp. PhB160 TaxID=2485192 RepID=UPI000F465438|nr:winged helix DNA-binding domain-containing protein [Frigoribacterium sp. PhB160]ROS61615.1 winged helix DNA-binding protein [Frigoribacterium sp. PhB160]